MVSGHFCCKPCFADYMSLSMVGGTSDICRAFWHLTYYCSWVQFPRMLTELAHEPPWRLFHRFPPLPLWLLLVYSDQHSLLLRLLPHLLYPSKSLEVVPGFYFLLSLLMVVCSPLLSVLPPLPCIHWCCPLQRVPEGGTSPFTLFYVGLSRFWKDHHALPVAVSIEGSEQVFLGLGKRVTVGNPAFKRSSPLGCSTVTQAKVPVSWLPLFQGDFCLPMPLPLLQRLG